MKATLKLDSDVIVVGAGLAGFAAAIGASKLGMKTLLVESTGVIGGLAVNGLVNPFMKYDYAGEDLIQGVFSELIERLKKAGDYVGRAFNYEALKYHLVNLLKENRVNILLYTQIIDLQIVEKKIQKIIGYAAGQRVEIRGKQFIDCTGDAALGKLAELTLLIGDEQSRQNQAMTQMFVLDNVQLNKTMEYVQQHPDDFFSWVSPQQKDIAISVAGFFKLVEQAIEDGMDLPRDHFFFIQLPQKTSVVVNTGHISITDANDPLAVSAAQLTGLEQTHQLTAFAQKYLPGFENCYLRQSAAQIGIRESARIKGKYIFQQSDVTDFSKFPDAVVKAIYGVDIHQNQDEPSVKEVVLNYTDYYEIPARALIAAELDNLLMAGRNLSADFGGQSAVRIMPTCCGTGQGAGVIAALAALTGRKPADITATEFQAALKKQGANL